MVLVDVGTVRENKAKEEIGGSGSQEGQFQARGCLTCHIVRL